MTEIPTTNGTRSDRLLEVLERQRSQHAQELSRQIDLRTKKLAELATIDAEIEDIKKVIRGMEPAIRSLKDSM